MKRRFSQLTLDDRRQIEHWWHMRLSPDEMARRLGRHRSTIFRELRRTHYHDVDTPKLRGYWGVLAQRFRDGRRHKDRKLVAYPKLLCAVTELLSIGWTPEQTAGRMAYEGLQPRVCQETIYRHIYSDEGRAAQLWRYLPTGRRRRRGYRLPPNLRPNLVSCSVQTRWLIAASSATGKQISFTFAGHTARPMLRRWSKG